MQIPPTFSHHYSFDLISLIWKTVQPPSSLTSLADFNPPSFWVLPQFHYFLLTCCFSQLFCFSLACKACSGAVHIFWWQVTKITKNLKEALCVFQCVPNRHPLYVLQYVPNRQDHSLYIISTRRNRVWAAASPPCHLPHLLHYRQLASSFCWCPGTYRKPCYHWIST